MLVSRNALVLVAAFVALSCSNVLGAVKESLPLAGVVDSADANSNSLPEAVPDRSALSRRKLQQDKVLDELTFLGLYSGTGDGLIDDPEIGDLVLGAYGYYGYYGASPPPLPLVTGGPVTSAPTETPEPTDEPEPTLPPLGPEERAVRFVARFPGDPAAILSSPARLEQFKNDLIGAVSSSFSSLGVTPQMVQIASVRAGTSSRRRNLLQNPSLDVEYRIRFNRDTPDSVLAQVTERTVSTPGDVFPSTFTSAYSLSAPQVTQIAEPTTPGSPPPGTGQNTGSPPPSPPPPPGSAARTPVSFAMIALSFFGSSMLLALLW